MVNAVVRAELLQEFESLSLNDQRRVLDFARALATTSSRRGTPGRDLRELVGTLSDEDAKEMMDAIEQYCERIDESEWPAT